VKTFEAANAVGSHVLVQVKDNQEGLQEAVEKLAVTTSPVQTCETTDKMQRGRQETRRVEMFGAGPLLGLERWAPHALSTGLGPWFFVTLRAKGGRCEDE
jgi:hypothetical protein